MRPIDADKYKQILERFREHLIEFGEIRAGEAVSAIMKGLKLQPTLDSNSVCNIEEKAIDTIDDLPEYLQGKYDIPCRRTKELDTTETENDT